MPEPVHVDLLVVGGTILTMNRERRVIENGALAILGQHIVQVGPAQEVLPLVKPAHTVNASGMVIMPGLVNTHGHWAMTLFRGLVDDRPLEAWLGTIWKTEAAFATPENVTAGSQLAIMEMIRSGTTCAADMYWHFENNTQAAIDANFRMVNGPSFAQIDGFEEVSLSGENAEAYLQQYQNHPLVHTCVQMHATYTVNGDLMKTVRELAEKYQVGFITHASESRGEMENVRAMYGKTPIEVLRDNGLLGPRTLLAHAVHLSDAEIALLAETGTSVAHCPASNFKLSSGIARVADMLKVGVNVAIGTDGPASNNDLDMLQEASLAAMMQKAVSGDPTVLPAEQMVEMVTIRGAQAVGLADKIGSLEAGKLADVAILDLDALHLMPCYDVYSHLIYSACKSDFRHVIINGKLVMEDRCLLTLDEQAVKQQIKQISRDIQRLE